MCHHESSCFWCSKCKACFSTDLIKVMPSSFTFSLSCVVYKGLDKLNRSCMYGLLLTMEDGSFRSLSCSWTYFQYGPFVNFVIFSSQFKLSTLYTAIMDRKMSGEDISTNDIVQVSYFHSRSLNITAYVLLPLSCKFSKVYLYKSNISCIWIQHGFASWCCEPSALWHFRNDYFLFSYLVDMEKWICITMIPTF